MTTHSETIARAHIGASIAIAVVLTSCGDGGSSSEQAAVAPVEAATTTVEPVPATTEPPTTTRVPETVADTTTAPEPTAPPPSTEPPCESSCPVSDDDRALIEASFAAYNSGDWAAWTATLVDDEPEWVTDIGPQSAALVEFDFIWSAAMNDVWSVGECLTRRNELLCDIEMEDDLQRGLATLGREPSQCRLIVEVVDGLVDIKRYDLGSCHSQYDFDMHNFGVWFEQNYPDLDPIQGFHYRAWNQTDTTAGARAQEHLAEYLEWRLVQDY